MPKINHTNATLGKVLGTYRRGVSVDESPMNIILWVGNLAGMPDRRERYYLTAKTAKSLGLALLMASARLEISEANRLPLDDVKPRRRAKRAA